MITAPQGLIDPAARLQQRREERPDPHLRDPQLDVTRRCRQQPGPGPVALVRAGLDPLVRRGADRRGELGVDQLLHPVLAAAGGTAPSVSPSPSRASRSATRASSSWVIVWFLLNELLGRFSPRVTRWPTHQVDPSPTYTTSRDANSGVSCVRPGCQGPLGASVLRAAGVGQGGAPAAKRGRTTLTNPRAGAHWLWAG